jgi:peptidylprolyl isomerase
MHHLRLLFAAAGLLLLAACGTPTNSTASQPQNATSESGAGAQSTTTGGGAGRKQYSAPPAMAIDPNKQYTATINTTKGTMKAELYAKDAPMTVNNFVVLSRDGFYNGVKFHRIIKDFMVQTGDPVGDGTGGPGYEFKDEPITRDYTRGTLAMANHGADTNGSQFFIVHQDYALDKKYTIFGKVTEGLNVLDAIANVPVDVSDRGEPSVPKEDVRINSITIEEK